MKHRTFPIEFEGYWRGAHLDQLPLLCGIFCVYACQDHPVDGSVQLLRLIGIESADDVRASVARRTAEMVWYRFLRDTEELCFNYGHVAPADRVRCEAALVHYHKPLESSEYKECFPFDATTISIRGRIALLHPHFTVQPSAS